MLERLQRDLLTQMDKLVPDEGYGTFKQQRLRALFKLTDTIIDEHYGKIAKTHQSSLIDLADLESSKTVDLVNGKIGTALLTAGVPEATLKALVNDDIVQGRPAQYWWEQQGVRLQGEFRRVIRQGVFAGDTLGQLKQRVRGTRANRFQDGLMTIESHKAEALIRTSVQSVVLAARHETLRANDDVLTGEEALVTLDNRTSEICMGRSGFAWDFEGKPLNRQTNIPFPGPPPWHFNCRTVMVPVLKSWEQLQREAKQDTTLGKKLDRLESKIGKGTQASMDGQVAADLTYHQWLKQQSPEQQQEILGMGRWKLWKEGEINLTDLVYQNGRPLTLAQLRAL